IWGEDCDITTRTVDNHIAGLRKKIETNPEAPQHIVTVYKVGYRWSPQLVAMERDKKEGVTR
ncbi:MAG: winged helix-turn-helix domain-containing protein, partial [Calditrichota bacterium]